ncbi:MULTISPECIES: radical SAM protein [unclassified Campylobacter]|uniref:radical SAM protein n=1 Tax=unclassified Campylobacter TaxID=2593542 RepID=UPI0022E9985B|nr:MULTISPECIES: radical SAM protein [unclassified Campylobacter]MDA3053930.1 radical SAM protein [Campylobacter sp. VBCF_07 NA4]MDA3060183.1 radical SAM protein [Campylobacter sp. VBCF_02 NA5]MDA3069697.1 radical SAM protein [Campylobacter sp. VBCF_08 NA3]WBR54971.1 radical SAM protein [Campylobacter sp. VBCF_01 NA2]
MNFASGINRPPYESADGYLQTTIGCSHNHCLFCTYFKDQKFQTSPLSEIEADIKEIPSVFGAPKRIFLQGADGFAASYDTLMRVAELLHKYVPSVKSICGYARIDNFYDKSAEQIRNLAAAGFADPYIGVESGDDIVLKKINKGYTSAQAREVLEKLDAAGFKFF